MYKGRLTNLKRDIHVQNQSPHFDGDYEGPISAPDSPKMGIQIDANPMKHTNPNPYQMSTNGKKGIGKFSDFFKGKEH